MVWKEKDLMDIFFMSQCKDGIEAKTRRQIRDHTSLATTKWSEGQGQAAFWQLLVVDSSGT